ncbi:hypothetical protein MD484_g6224, partial [Candolleomyces efflorescens]
MDFRVLTRLFSICPDLYFAYLEIDPLLDLDCVNSKEGQVRCLSVAV